MLATGSPRTALLQPAANDSFSSPSRSQLIESRHRYGPLLALPFALAELVSFGEPRLRPEGAACTDASLPSVVQSTLHKSNWTETRSSRSANRVRPAAHLRGPDPSVMTASGTPGSGEGPGWPPLGSSLCAPGGPHLARPRAVRRPLDAIAARSQAKLLETEIIRLDN